MVQPVQEINLFLGVMPVIPHELADDRVILLFHMGVVVPPIRTGPGQGDAPGMAEADEMVVHELTSVVCMERGRDPDTCAGRTPVQPLHTLLLSSVQLLLQSIPYSDP